MLLSPVDMFQTMVKADIYIKSESQGGISEGLHCHEGCLFGCSDGDYNKSVVACLLERKKSAWVNILMFCLLPGVCGKVASGCVEL